MTSIQKSAPKTQTQDPKQTHDQSAKDHQRLQLQSNKINKDQKQIDNHIQLKHDGPNSFNLVQCQREKVQSSDVQKSVSQPKVNHHKLNQNEALKSHANSKNNTVSQALIPAEPTASQFDAMVSTNIKTPRHNQAKNICSKVGEHAYGLFNDSHQKSKAATLQELSHISPFSQKHFKFSGAGYSTGLSRGLDHPSAHYQHTIQGSMSKRARQAQTGEFDQQIDVNTQPKANARNEGLAYNQTHSVNPFNTQNPHYIRPYQPTGASNDSIFGGSAARGSNQNGKDDEEDFEIKPHNIYGQQPIQQHHLQSSARKMNPEINQSANHEAEYEESQIMQIMHHQHHSFQQFQHLQYQQYMESFKNHQAQQMTIRQCPVHGEGSHYKETLAMMQAQAHAYAFSCFLHFQQMTKAAKSSEEKAYYQQQMQIAGCMVHGPHGMAPSGMMPPHPSMYFPGFSPFGGMPFGQQDYWGHSQKSSSEEKEQSSGSMAIHQQTTFGPAPNRVTKNRTKDESKAESKKENQEAQAPNEFFKQALKKTPEGIVDSVKLQSNLNQIHAKTLEKNYPKNRNKEDELFEDDNNYIHNTTGDQDRKKRKTLKTLVLSGSKMYQQVPNDNACPQIGQFCPETHEQQSQLREQNTQQKASNYSGINVHPSDQPQIQQRSPFTHHQQPPAYSSTVINPHQYSAHPYAYHSQISHGNQNASSPFTTGGMMTTEAGRKKRNRKNPNQMQYLMQEYQKDPNWTKETCLKVSQATGLTESQVYKWGWDQKNKKSEESAHQQMMQQQNDSQLIMQQLQKNSQIYINQLREKRDSEQKQRDSSEEKQPEVVMQKEFNLDDSAFVTPRSPKHSKNQVQANTKVTSYSPFTSDLASNSQNKPIFVIQSGKSNKSQLSLNAISNKNMGDDQSIDLIFQSGNQDQDKQISSKKSSIGISDRKLIDSKCNQISDQTILQTNNAKQNHQNTDQISNNKYQTTLSHNLKEQDINLKEAIAVTVIKKNELQITKNDSTKKKNQVSPQVGGRMTTRSRNTTPNKVVSAKEQDKENNITKPIHITKRNFKEAQTTPSKTVQTVTKKRDAKNVSKEAMKENMSSQANQGAKIQSTSAFESKIDQKVQGGAYSTNNIQDLKEAGKKSRDKSSQPNQTGHGEKVGKSVR